MEVKDKILSTDLNEWNNPKRMVALAPLFFVIGWSIGFLFSPHLVESSTEVSILNALFGVFGLLIGTVILAFID